MHSNMGKGEKTGLGWALVIIESKDVNDIDAVIGDADAQHSDVKVLLNLDSSTETSKTAPVVSREQQMEEETTPPVSQGDSARPVLTTQTCIHCTHLQIVTIKASYGPNAFIEFKLNSRSTFQDLQEQVTERLKWDANSFKTAYQDEENDWITIFNDEDFKECLQFSLELCKGITSMLVNLKVSLVRPSFTEKNVVKL